MVSVSAVVLASRSLTGSGTAGAGEEVGAEKKEGSFDSILFIWVDAEAGKGGWSSKL